MPSGRAGGGGLGMPRQSVHRTWTRLLEPPRAGAQAPPVICLDGLAASSTTFVAVVISMADVARISFPRAGASAFGLDGTADFEAAYQAAHALAPLVVSSVCSVESYLAGEILVGSHAAGRAPALRVVMTPIPVALSAAAIADPATAWLTLREIEHPVMYDVAATVLERLRVQSTPSRAVGVPLRVGRGATMSLTRDIAAEGGVARFDEACLKATHGRRALRAALLQRHAALRLAEPAKARFFRDCADAVRPPPLSEIPVGLRAEARDYSAPQLLTQPYVYRAVIPISDPPDLSGRHAPPVVWPEGVAPPQCERDFYTTECFADAFAALVRLDEWHASSGRSKRPPPFACGIAGVRPLFRDFVLTGGIVDWTVVPPRPLDPADTGYKPRMRGDRAATIFARSPDRRTTAAWTEVDARPFDPIIVLRIIPNLLTVYPDGDDEGGASGALAAEAEKFTARGWTRAAAHRRSFTAGHLGLPNTPFANHPAGVVPKAVGWRVVLEAGHPRVQWTLATGETVWSANDWHGPSRPSPGTPARLAGDAPAAQEFKPDVKEGINNTVVVGHGGEVAGLHVHELGFDLLKAFHQWTYSFWLIAVMGTIVPDWRPSAAGMVALRNYAMAMGWLPASKECQFGMNQVNAEILRRLGVSEDARRAAGGYTAGEILWHDARASLAPNPDYGRQDIMCSLSTYADDPRGVSAGEPRTCDLVGHIYDVCGPDEGLDLIFADSIKWLLSSWSAWQGVRLSASLNLVWVSPAKALRTAAALDAIAASASTLRAARSHLGFLNHVVAYLHTNPYALRVLWQWYDDAVAAGGHDDTLPEATDDVGKACSALSRIVINQPGTSLLRSVRRRVLPYGSVTEWLIDTDACFDIEVDPATGIVSRGDKDPPGMGGDFYGAAWNYTFTDEELQVFTIPTAELTAAWMGVHQYEGRLRHADAICMQIDALASPRVLTERARTPRMVAVHEEILADPLFHQLVDVRRCLSCRHVWGHANPKGDAPSRSRWDAAERLAWQMGQTLRREAPAQSALAFKDRVAARLRALRHRDVAAPGGWAVQFSSRRPQLPLTPPPPLVPGPSWAPRPPPPPPLAPPPLALPAVRSPHRPPSPDHRVRRRVVRTSPVRAEPRCIRPLSLAPRVVTAMAAVLGAPDAGTATRTASELRGTLAGLDLSPLRCRRQAPLLAADFASVRVPSYELPAAARAAAAPGRAISRTAEAQIENLIELVTTSAKPWALRPSSPGRLRSMLTGLAGLQEQAAPDNTLAQEKSNFKYWAAWCAEWNTSTTRPSVRSLSADEYMVESAFWGAAVPWIHERMRDRHGVLGMAQPQSSLSVLRGIKRSFQRLGIETVPLSAAVKACDGLLRQYVEDHGPESLIPHRKEPLTMDIILGMLGQTGGNIGRRLLNWAEPAMCSLRTMFHTLAQTGFRKSEVSLHEKATFGLQHLSMANVHWSIGGVTYAAPTAEQLATLATGDYALLRPPPSKSDQFSLHWGASTIYLPFDPAAPICAARELAREEVRRAVPAADRRRKPLFVNATGGPWRHSELNTVFHHLLARVVGPDRARFFSMHSWRIYLACALLAAGASAGTIQGMLRWRSDDALKIYARINDAKYADWLSLAAVATVSSVRTTTTSALAERLRAAPPAPEAGDRLAAFQTYWLQQVREAPAPGADLLAGLSAIEIDDSRRVAALEGASSALLAAATRADQDIAAEFGLC